MWIGETRLLEVGGAEKIARDFAKQEGRPVAIVGEGAVDCPRCKASNGDWCKTGTGGQARWPHAERVFAMNKEIERLRMERGSG